MSALEHVQIAPLAPQPFKEILTDEQSRQLDRTIARGDELLGDRVVWNVNSTMRGGGVAEMLGSLVAYGRGAGVDTRWVVMRGNPDFFRVTKRIHNMLHGSPVDGGARVVWRCHVGIDLPNDLARETWAFLRPYVAPAAAYIFSREAFAWDDLDRSRVVIIPPSIDAFSAKNQSLEPDAVTKILAAAAILDARSVGSAQFARQDGSRGRVNRQAELHGTTTVPTGAPTIVQVSR